MSAPLTPPECDLQDFPFMPLHVARLRDSDLAAEAHPEACWYAVLLWAASWHQLPAGSLPDNETVLARLCGLGRDLKTFRKHRADAMRGFVRCDDGRLYHPVVCEQVNAAWAEKLAYRERKAKRHDIAVKAAEARWGSGEADASSIHEAPEADAPSTADAMPKGTGTGRGISRTEASASVGATDAPPPDTTPRKAKRGSRLPDDWEPGEADIEIARREGLTDEEITRAAREFRNYWTSRTGGAATKLSWPRTWENRVIEIADRQRRGGPRLVASSGQSGGGGRGASSFADIYARRHGFVAD